MPTKKKLLNLGLKSLEYTLRLSRQARRVRLSIYQDGRVVVSGPRYVSERSVEKFLLTKADWIIDKQRYFKSLPPVIKPIDDVEKFLAHKNKARLLVLDKLDFFNKTYQQKFNRVFIRNQKTRWGSCSSKRNLSFNYKIVLLSERLVDYIIVHELCHLIEMNHSIRFWRQVARIIPDYNKVRQELRAVKIALKEI